MQAFGFLAVVYFVSFVVMISFIVLNLFIAVVTANMTTASAGKHNAGLELE